MSVNSAVILILSLILRTLPLRMKSAFVLSFIFSILIFLPLNSAISNLETTDKSLTLDNRDMISSVSPSAK